MNVFMICVVTVLVGLVLAGEAFEDRLALMLPSQTYSSDFLLSLRYNNYEVEAESVHKRRRSRIKKRGSRGRIRNSLQRCHKSL